jgi:hypothetical protein
VRSGGAAILALRRGPREGRTILALHNLSGTPQAVDPAALGGAPAYVDILGGRSVEARDALSLAPYEVLWLA